MIFSIAMGAEYLFYMKSIETHARAFLALIILPIGTVSDVPSTYSLSYKIFAKILSTYLFSFFSIELHK